MLHLKVREYMTADPKRVHEDDTIRKVCELMDPGSFRHLPVVDDKDKVVGMISDRDLRNIKAALDVLHEAIEGEPGRVHVRDVMTTGVIELPPDASLREAAVKMNELKIGGIAVVENNKLAGIITYTDILTAMIDVMDGKIPATARA